MPDAFFAAFFKFARDAFGGYYKNSKFWNAGNLCNAFQDSFSPHRPAFLSNQINIPFERKTLQIFQYSNP